MKEIELGLFRAIKHIFLFQMSVLYVRKKVLDFWLKTGNICMKIYLRDVTGQILV